MSVLFSVTEHISVWLLIPYIPLFQISNGFFPIGTPSYILITAPSCSGTAVAVMSRVAVMFLTKVSVCYRDKKNILNNDYL